ncbi:MAG: arylsulfatase [Rikenellaceae bacterium]
MNKLNLLTTTLLCTSVAMAVEAKESQPNVIFIMVDDLGFGDLSCYGSELISTPNIDKLAKEGRQFIDAHSASSVSTASRYSMITGQYAFRGSDKPEDPTAGIWGPLRMNSPLIVERDLLTVGKVMQSQGYKTACVGKWHLGWGESYPTMWNDSSDLSVGPNAVGFDYYYGLPHVSSSAPYVYICNNEIVGGDANDPLLLKDKNNPAPISETQIYPNKSENKFTGATAAHALYKDDEAGIKMAEESVNFIKENKKNPFFLYLATPHIHHPFTPNEKFQGSSKCGVYGDFIQELDWIFGEVMNCLKEEKLDKNTLVIFTSDNGGMLNEAAREAREVGHNQNGDLLGFKFGIWEGGHRVPYIVRWPKKIKAGSISEQVISNVDLLATLAALTGYELQDGDGVDSYNMLEAYIGNPKELIREEMVLTSRFKTHQSLRSGDWVYIPTQGGGGWNNIKPTMNAWGGVQAVSYYGQENSDIEDGKVKKDAPKAQLYNLAEDRSQTTNVIKDYPEIAEIMKSRLREMLQSKTTR